MKKISFFIIFSLSGFFLISSHLFATSRSIRITAKSGENFYLYKDYHALVVGVSDYQKWPKLPNAVNDAKEVASKLEKMGFEVKLVLDPTSQEMKTALNQMIYNTGIEEDRGLLLYYAGHGETETLADKTKMGYIIARDCPLLTKDPLGFGAHAISMRDIESASLRIRSKHVLMLFDSCFSGSLFALVRAVPDDITEKSTLPVRQYITAGREDEEVPDRSMFKRCFLLGLDGDADLTGDGYVTGSELGMYLSDKVVNYTRRQQHPQYGKINNPNLDRGDFIFVPSTLEAKLKAAEERLRKEIAEKKALEEELKRLKAEMEKISHLAEEPQAKEAKEKRLVYLPKKVKDAIVPEVKLRSVSEELWGPDIKRMIEKHNFFVRDLNEKGDFPNNFVDNGVGTITDRATGLRWQKGGSLKELHYWDAKNYVSHLNYGEFSGYKDWRIPTIEELCSLLERKVNQRVQHISPLFEYIQSKCWSADLSGGHTLSEACGLHFIVDFNKGKIDHAATEPGSESSGDLRNPEVHFIRAVRTVK